MQLHFSNCHTHDILQLIQNSFLFFLCNWLFIYFHFSLPHLAEFISLKSSEIPSLIKLCFKRNFEISSFYSFDVKEIRFSKFSSIKNIISSALFKYTDLTFKNCAQSVQLNIMDLYFSVFKLQICISREKRSKPQEDKILRCSVVKHTYCMLFWYNTVSLSDMYTYSVSLSDIILYHFLI